jgi:hypothetical protein
MPEKVRRSREENVNFCASRKYGSPVISHKESLYAAYNYFNLKIPQW